MARSKPPSTASLLALALLLAITLVVRIGVLVTLQDNLQQDPDAYRNIAENLIWFRVYGMGTSREKPPHPTAYRPPLYPLVLAKFASDDSGVVLWRVAAVHVVLGLATVALAWLVAGQMLAPIPKSKVQSQETGDRKQETAPIVFPFAAGLMVACDPLLLHQSTLMMTETLAAFLTTLCLFALNRFTADGRPWNAGLAGGAIGLAILCRPTYLPWLGLVGLTMVLMRGSPKSKTQSPNPEAGRSGWHAWLWRGMNVATLGLIAAAVVSPWAIRNYRAFGKPIVSTTHGGYTLLLGNNDKFYDHLSAASAAQPWDSASLKEEIAANHFQWLETRIADWNRQRRNDLATINPRTPAFEVVHDETLYWKALDEMSARPYDFAYACLYRLRQFWSPLPHQLTADEPPARMAMRFTVAAWYVAVYLLAAVGIWNLRGRLLAPPWLWGLLLCLVYTGIHAFYWTNLRMRAPVMPIVALAAAYGLAAMVNGWQRTAESPSGQAG